MITTKIDLVQAPVHVNGKTRTKAYDPSFLWDHHVQNIINLNQDLGQPHQKVEHVRPRWSKRDRSFCSPMMSDEDNVGERLEPTPVPLLTVRAPPIKYSIRPAKDWNDAHLFCSTNGFAQSALIFGCETSLFSPVYFPHL